MIIDHFVYIRRVSFFGIFLVTMNFLQSRTRCCKNEWNVIGQNISSDLNSRLFESDSNETTLNTTCVAATHYT